MAYIETLQPLWRLFQLQCLTQRDELPLDGRIAGDLEIEALLRVCPGHLQPAQTVTSYPGTNLYFVTDACAQFLLQ